MSSLAGARDDGTMRVHEVPPFGRDDGPVLYINPSFLSSFEKFGHPSLTVGMPGIPLRLRD